MALNLVTGGSGYFGSVMVRRLLEAGERVRIFDLFDAPDRPKEAEFVKGDIRDPGAVAEACREVEVVHHNVALVPLARDRRMFWSVNVDGTGVLLAAAKAAGVKKLISVASSAVFGIPEKNPVDETTAPRPLEAYGRAKLAGEEFARQFAGEGLDVTIIRPRTILGPGRLGIFQVLFEWIKENRAVYVLGGGGNRYQFVHADDLAAACIRAAARPGPEVYNIGSERFGTMRETIAGLIAHAGTTSRIRSLPMGLASAAMRLAGALHLAPLAPYHALMFGRELYFDISKAKRELDWAPEKSSVEALSEAYDWYVAHREEIMSREGGSTHRSPVKQGLLRLLRWIS